jgi:exodeoxyribonuclease VII large subunit
LRRYTAPLPKKAPSVTYKIIGVFMEGMQILTVTELTRCIKGVIEAEDLFAAVWVRGEVSNLTMHASGHVYFSLKDEGAVIRSVMWSNVARTMRFTLKKGMRITALGRVTLYEKQGQYQLSVTEVTPDGIGAMYAALEELKNRLREEGMFDASRKKPLPPLPRKIAIITSRTAAALRDMVSIARRRMPCVDILLVPALMQGADSEASVVDSLRLADSIPDADLIVLGRGGGSIEDLWTFNSEQVVRAICACTKPVISAIGHETDFTLADMAADMRAPTPSAAMEMALPDFRDLLSHIEAAVSGMATSLRSKMSALATRLDSSASAPCMSFPARMLEGRWQRLDMAGDRLFNVFSQKLSRHGSRLGEVTGRLESLSPLGVLSRGYTATRRPGGELLRGVRDVLPGETIETLFFDGSVLSEVKMVKEGDS